jgi:hypothetical protein
MHLAFAPLACRVILARGPRAAFKDSAQLSGTAPRRLRDSVTLTHPCQHAAAHLVPSRLTLFTPALAAATVTAPTRPATIDAPAAVTTVAARRYHHVPQVALAAAPDALIAGLIATFQRRILRISLNTSNFGASKISATKAPTALLLKRRPARGLRIHKRRRQLMVFLFVSSSIFNFLFLQEQLKGIIIICVLSVGSVHGLPLWRAVYREGCFSVFSSWPDQLLFATRWSAPFIRRS